MKKEKDKPKHNQIVNYFFVLKGWDYKSKEFYVRKNITYGRYVGPAKELLTLCNGSVEEAKESLDIISLWADSIGLGWAIETIFKKWPELYTLQPKEKEPYFRDMRIVEKNNKKFCVPNDGGSWLEFCGEESEIIYK